MPSQYQALLDALNLTDIPFAEYQWTTRPEGTYGLVSLDMEDGSLDADGVKMDRSWEASVDVFFYLLKDRESIVTAVESALEAVCGTAWELNSVQYETGTGLFHYEWVCTLLDEAVK